MFIAIDDKLLANVTEALLATHVLINESRSQILELTEQVKANKLLTEAQAQAYLGRDHDTLRYYRTLGLESFKKGKDRWYLKSDIDAWLASGKVSRHNRN